MLLDRICLGESVRTVITAEKNIYEVSRAAAEPPTLVAQELGGRFSGRPWSISCDIKNGALANFFMLGDDGFSFKHSLLSLLGEAESCCEWL